jgi:RHS repeat-associated protein
MVFALQVSRAPNAAGGNLNAGNPAIGANQPSSLRYMHHDHLGSVAVVTNETGAVLERLAFDPWGKRRNINGLADTTDSLVGLTTDRGYTEHEHLDEMGVIHMNGRIYDPLIGRMMSADPFIQAPAALQSYNRYSYVMNNPLNLTDPSGYSWWTNVRGIVVRAIAAVADAYGCSGYCSAAVGAYQGYHSGAGWKGAVVGGVSSYYGYQYGGNYGVTGYAVSAASGCASASVNGGNCGRGAAGGVVNHFGGQYGVTGQASAGCVSARINGGSCGQGARDAVTSYAINYVVRSGIDTGVQAYREVQRQTEYRNNLTACSDDCSTGYQRPGVPSPFAVQAQAQKALAVKIDQFFSEVGDQLSYIFKSDSITLARNMAQDGDMTREAGQHAHHIVAASDARAEPARLILISAGMDINSAFNGIFLDGLEHARIHTNIYYNAVNSFLSGSSGYADVATRLTGMRVLINAGKFPF